MPPATLNVFRDHGRSRPTLTKNVEEAISIMDLLQHVGIPSKELTDKLLAEGVKQFAGAFAKLLKATDRNGKASGHDPMELLRLKQLFQNPVGAEVMYNKYTRQPEKLRAWQSASHVERVPQREKKPTPAPTPTPPA